jgi:hypothetical protein
MTKDLTQKYIDLMKANSEIVQNNISHTQIYQDNQQLRADNQALKYDRVDLINSNRMNIQKLDKINKATFHAGCMGNPDCLLCPVQKIIRGND